MLLMNTSTFNMGQFGDFPAQKHLEKKQFMLFIVCFPREEGSDSNNRNEARTTASLAIIIYVY